MNIKVIGNPGFYLRRDDNRTLFVLGSDVSGWGQWLGAGTPFVVVAADEEVLAAALERHMTAHKWNTTVDGRPGGISGYSGTVADYACFVAREIVRWCDGRPFQFIEDDGYNDWIDDLSWDPAKAVTGSRYERWRELSEEMKFSLVRVKREMGEVFDCLAKHSFKVVRGDIAVHLVSLEHPEMFRPCCPCGWEGTWVKTPEIAQQHGAQHVAEEVRDVRSIPDQEQPGCLLTFTGPTSVGES